MDLLGLDRHAPLHLKTGTGTSKTWHSSPYGGLKMKFLTLIGRNMEGIKEKIALGLLFPLQKWTDRAEFGIQKKARTGGREIRGQSGVAGTEGGEKLGQASRAERIATPWKCKKKSKISQKMKNCGARVEGGRQKTIKHINKGGGRGKRCKRPLPSDVINTSKKNPRRSNLPRGGRKETTAF